MEDYPEGEVLLSLYDPNAINLYNRMKESEELGICFEGNHFDTEMDEDKLMMKIRELNMKEYH